MIGDDRGSPGCPWSYFLKCTVAARYNGHYQTVINQVMQPPKTDETLIALIGLKALFSAGPPEPNSNGAIKKECATYSYK